MSGAFRSCLAIAILLSTALAVTTAAADGACKLQGTWIITLDEEGSIPVGIATYHGQSVSSGTSDVLFPSLGGMLVLPTGYGATDLRGVWERTGGNTFDFTLVGYAFDEAGDFWFPVKNSGSKILYEDCNKMDVVGTLEVGETCTPAVLHATRVVVEPPCELLSE